MSDPSPRPMTVLQVIPRLDTGGAERACIEIAEALTAAGHRALVAGAPGRLCTDLEAVGGAFHEFDGATKSPFRLWRNAGWLARLIAAEGVDIVHARSRAPAWSARFAARRTGIPFVTTYHGIYGERNRLKRLYNSVMTSGDRVIANSAFTADLIRRRYGTPEARLVTINRGVDLRRFDPARVPADRVRALRAEWKVAPDTAAIVLAGRLTDWKGQAVLIRAAARLRDTAPRDFAIVFVGAGQGRDGYRAELDALVAELGVGGLVRFAGHSDDMPAVFAAADIAVSASTKPEAFGRAIVEAEAMATPIVVTDLGPTAETVRAPPRAREEDRTGWSVPPDDPDALAKALAEALSLPKEALAEIGARGRIHVEGAYALTTMTAATLHVYRAVLKERAGHAAFS